MLIWVEHEKSFITSGLDEAIVVPVYEMDRAMRKRVLGHMWTEKAQAQRL